MTKEAAARNPPPIEAFHALGLLVAGAGLAAGLLARNAVWVRSAVSLILFLPPLRVLTTVADEVVARRYRVAFTGLVVLSLLVVSRVLS